MEEKLRENDRKDRVKVLVVIRKELEARNTRWLLCLDNVDKAELNGIVDEVCRMAEPEKSKG